MVHLYYVDSQTHSVVHRHDSVSKALENPPPGIDIVVSDIQYNVGQYMEPSANCVVIRSVSLRSGGESFGPVFNEDGSPSEATKAFARENDLYHFAYLLIHAGTAFPMEAMLAQGAEFCTPADTLRAARTREDRQVMLRHTRSRSRPFAWSGSWHSYVGFKFFVLS